MRNNQLICISTSITILFTLFCTNSVSANSGEDIKQAIEQSSKAFIEETLVSPDIQSDSIVSVRKIDPRIVVPSCSQAFEYSAPSFDNRMSTVAVKVTCPESQWFTFVNAQIRRLQKVIVASTTMSPGAILSVNNVKTIEIDRQRIRGSTFQDVNALIGAKLKRRVREETIITSNMLCFVCKGDRVTVTAKTGNLAIKVSGMALEDGTLGESIRVENTSTSKAILAEVVSNDEVVVNI